MNEKANYSAKDPKRRDFLGMSLVGVGALGAIASIVAMKRTWDPLPSVVSAGITVIDIGTMQEGEFRQSQWRGKPIYIIRKQNDATYNQARDFKIDEAIFTMGVQVCTHLGCIPLFQENTKGFFCPCHGGKYTIDGVNVAGTPPPTPFEIPPFKIDGTKLTLGVSSPIYEEMIKKA